MDKRVLVGGAVAVVVVAGGLFFRHTQQESAAGIGLRSAPPPAPSAQPQVLAGTTRFRVADAGLATFLIDAPLEKIKGRSTKFRGTIDLDPLDVTKSHGEIDVDLDDLKTETFEDLEKNTSQTGHAHNWLELGADVKEREQNRFVRFTFTALESATPSKLDADTQEPRTLKVVAKGNLWLHGITSPKSIPLTVVLSGSLNGAPSIKITSDSPLRISLKEHDVKPRDVAGKFLNGALEKVGKKIDDSVQITLDFFAVGMGKAATK